MTLTRFIGVVAVAAGTAVGVAGQAPQAPGAPQRGGAAQGPRPTAVILGQVVDAATGIPVPEVTVTAAVRMDVAPAARAGGAGNQVRMLTNTDGKFVLRDIPIGAVQLSTSAPGYVNGGFGQTRPGGAVQPFMIQKDEKVANATIRIWRTASITGMVLDERGEPRPGITVRAMRRTFLRGQPRLGFQGVALFSQSDDRGIYRISGLTPGDYVVVTPQTQMAMPAATMENAVQGALSGDITALMSAGLEFASSGGAMLNAGVRIGDLMVGTQEGLMPIPRDDGRLSVYTTRFHPGVDVPSQATVLTLRSGEERSGIDLSLTLVPTVSVSGIVVGPNGPVSSVGVRLRHANESLVPDQSVDVAATNTRADGSFLMPAVPVGNYILRVLRTPRPGPTAAQLAEVPEELKAMMGALAQSGPNDTMTLFAAQPLALERDVAGVTVALSSGATLSGHIEFDGTAAPPSQVGAQVSLTAVAGEWVVGASAAPTAGRVNPDGTFVTAGYPPGRYLVTVGGRVVPGWFLKSVTVNGRDAAFEAFELDGRDLTGVVVTFTDKRTTLSGTVEGAAAANGGAATVVVFPSAWREWIASGMPPQLARAARTQPTGAFSIVGLPPREFVILAVDNLDAPDMQDPTVFEALARAATTVRLGDGETQTVALRIAQGVR